MKKLMTLLVAVALVLGVVAVPALADDVTTVRFWSHVNTAWNADWYQIIEEFEAEHPDIKIEYEQFPYDDLSAKTQTSLMASGEGGADVYEVWGGWILDFTAAGALAPAPDYLVAELEGDTYAPVLGTLTYEGQIYGAPLELNAEYGGMIVNKNLFEAAGLEYPTTWDEMMAICEQVSVEGEMRGLQFSGNDTLFFNWIAMILQNGGDIFDENGHINFNSDVAISCMETLVSYVKDAHYADNVAVYDYETSGMSEVAVLAIDECYMCMKGAWAYVDAAATYEREMGVDIDYVKTPAFVEGVEQKWAAETGWSMCVNAKTEVYDAAWEFISFALEPERLLRHNIACGQIPPRKSVATDPAFVEAVPYMAPVIELLDYAEYVGRFNTDPVKTYCKNMFLSLTEDDGTYGSVAEACAALQQQIEDNVIFY